MASRRTRRPSMFDVARLAGVSHQTVSRVINHSASVAADTRRKVMRAIDELDYRPSNSARALASRNSRMIGLIAGGQRFYGPVTTIAAIETLARANELTLNVVLMHNVECTQQQFNGFCEPLLEQEVDAAIILAPTDAMFEAAIRAPLSQPRVIVTSSHGAMSIPEAMRLLPREKRSKTSCVGIDQYGAMAEVHRLVLDYGHRNVLYFAGPQDWRDAYTRLRAWNKACFSSPMSSVTVQCSSWDAGEAYQRMNHVLENIGRIGAKPPTCVICANDAHAIGVLRALHEHGVRVPQEVSVVGFDDMPAVDNMTPPLTTVRPDFDALGTQVMRDALYLMGKGPEAAFSISSHGIGLVPAKPVLRKSLAPAARA
ncbi:LacI family transcriptional regulator [Bifidobacterium dolichotidis]|uniref:LacI family transcriptional regulator n=1 Tax=Bifidobacterium dolichotidis TaxID=2306976 RepID=A0A430FRK6_9BIFI|nr:LacI family DNA-binding transcriptional regulator [Bifidobacterium dolichotidis]RSX55511.1 LacI family transcriptional regulator [Bifidobacterium dolichotidis]